MLAMYIRMLLLVLLLVLAIMFSVTTYGLSLIAWTILLSFVIKSETGCDKLAIQPEDHIEARKDLAREMFDKQRNKFGVKACPSWCKSVEEFTDTKRQIYQEFLAYVAQKNYQEGVEVADFNVEQFHAAILKDASNFLLLAACAEIQGFADKKEQWDLALESYYYLFLDQKL